MSSDKVAATFHPDDEPALVHPSYFEMDFHTPPDDEPLRCSICRSTEHLAINHDLPPWLQQDLRDRSKR